MTDTLVCFISHKINDKLIERYNSIKEAASAFNYDVIWVSPNIKLDDKNIIFLKITNKFDNINNNSFKNHKTYINVFKYFNNYKYYWFIENDVTINNDNLVEGWTALFDFYKKNDNDLLCSKINKWSDNKGYQDRYPIKLLNKYYNNLLLKINTNILWFGFLPICRLSNELLVKMNDYYKHNTGYFEYTIPSLAKYYNMSIQSFSDDKFDIDESDNAKYDKINIGSIGWRNTKAANEYPLNTLIHPDKL